MKAKKLLMRVSSICLIAILAISVAACVKPPVEREQFVLCTSKEGTAGYAVGTAVSAVMKEYLKDAGFDLLILTSSTSTTKLICETRCEEAQACYLNNWGMKDLYNDAGPYSEKPCQCKIQQGWWWLPMQLTYITLADRDDINCLHDLAGKKVFHQAPASSNFDTCKAALTAIGVWDDIDTRTIDYAATADALKMGTIDAVVATVYYLGKSGAPWMTDVDARCDVKAIIPTAEEIKTIAAVPGLGWRYTDCADWLSGENAARWPDKAPGVSVNFGFHFAPCASTDIVYKIFKILIEEGDALAPYYATMADYAEYQKKNGPLALEVDSIDLNPSVPVHPGVAKYMKEHDVWKDTWVVGGA